MSAAAFLGKYCRIEGLDDPENRFVVRCGFGIAAVAMLLRIAFWAYTGRVWEDALITALHSENFVTGMGLTHIRMGEGPLQGFSSPIGLIIPVIGDFIKLGFGLNFLKLLSIPAAGLMVLYILGIGIHPNVKMAPALLIAAMGYVACEVHQILFGMGGMETQFSGLILLMSIYFTVAWRPVALGFSLGLCMLVRPDYCFWTVIAGVYTLFMDRKQIWKVAGIAVAIYLPWVIATTWYYGSPIPNTIVAKHLGFPHWWDRVDAINLFTLKRHTWMRLAEELHLTLGPTFEHQVLYFKGPESPIANLMFAFAVVGVLAILATRQWRLWPLMACVSVYSVYYVYLVPLVSSWYKVPYAVTLLLLSLRGIQAIASWIPKQRLQTIVLSVFAAAYLSLFLGVLPHAFQAHREIQIHVKNKVQKAVGLYLAEHMQADEAVGCEPLGYIGYYSRGNVYDWPGLCSEAVIRWSRENPDKRSLEEMLKGLRPEYLALRELEVLYWFEDNAWIKEDYYEVAVFEADSAIIANKRWGGQIVDTVFRVYKKKHTDDAQRYLLEGPRGYKSPFKSIPKENRSPSRRKDRRMSLP